MLAPEVVALAGPAPAAHAGEPVQPAHRRASAQALDEALAALVRSADRVAESLAREPKLAPSAG